jgi:hypothetical protein
VAEPQVAPRLKIIREFAFAHSPFPRNRRGCPGNRRRLRGRDPVQPKRIPVAGLRPAIHVFGAEILADLRRGCPRRAWTSPGRGFRNQDSRQNARHELPSNFPRTALPECGNPGSGVVALAPCSSQGQALDPRFRGGDEYPLLQSTSIRASTEHYACYGTRVGVGHV